MTFIKDWKELSEICNESATHILEINVEEGLGWIKAKDKRIFNPHIDFLEQIEHLDYYLSTHTFYGSNYKCASQVLQACGFDVELDNWDSNITG